MKPVKMHLAVILKIKEREKMMAKRINIILVISMIMIMFSFQSTSHVKAATQNTETTTGDIYFAVKYSDNIEPRQDDVFVLTYRAAEDKNGDATAQITVSTYELLKEEQKITLLYGGYAIVNIEYQGSNAGITNYSAKNQMNATSNSNDTLTIYIGLTEVDKFDHSWTESQIIKHGGVNVRELSADPSNPISYEDKMAEMIKEETKRQEESKNIQIGSNENTIEATDEASSGDYYEDDTYADDYGVTEQEPVSEQPEMEIHNSKTDNAKKHEVQGNASVISVKTVVTVAIILIACIIIIFVKIGSSSKTRR